MESQERIPYNLEAERYILGSMFIEPAIIGEVINRIGPNDFFAKENQNIMKAIYNLYNNREHVEAVKVTEELKRMNVLEASGGIDYIYELMESIPTIANVNSYLEVLEEKSLLRELYYLGDKLRQDVLKGSKNFASIGEDAEREMMRIINQKRTGDVKKIHRFTNQVLDIIESNRAKEGKVIGLDTGFEELNKLTFGFQKGELIILAARPAIGKSALALNIAANACKNVQAHVAFFSLEMGIDQLTMRLFSSFSGLSLTKVREGKLNPTEFASLLAAKASVDKLNLYLDETNNTSLSEIKSKCLKLKRENRLDLIIVDYLQLVQIPNFSGNRTEEVGRISRGLKIMARELEVPVLALSQLSRQAESQDRPMLAHLRESGSIEQDADIVMFLHREQIKKEGDMVGRQVRNHKTELIIAKNRQGATDTIELMFRGAQSTFNPIKREGGFEES